MGQTSFPPNGIIFAGAGILGATGAGSGASLTAAQVRAFASVYSTAEVDALIAASTPSWGSIGGTLSDQTDLQAALSAKADSTAVTTALAGKADKATTLAGYGITDGQPLDADLTAIAALTTTAHGRSLLTGADAAATRTTLGLGTMALQAATSYLALSGGTLTGPLAGTSASWSAGVTVTGGGTGGTDGLKFGSYGSGYGGIWAGSVTPSSTNYAIAIHANETNINSPSTVSLATGAANRWTVNSSGHFKPAVDNTYDAGGTSNKIRSLYTVSAVLGNTGTVTATQYGQLIGTHVGIRDAWSLSSISGTYPYGLLLGADSHLYWSSTADYYGTRDLGIARNAAGVLEINNGTTIAGGGSYGSLKAGATTLAGNLTFNNGNTVIISLNSTYNTSIRGSFDSIQLLSTSLLIAGPSGTTCGVSITGSLSMSGDFRLSNSVAAPVTSTDTTNVGVVRFDSNYLYVAVGTNSWKRVALSTW